MKLFFLRTLLKDPTKSRTRHFRKGGDRLFLHFRSPVTFALLVAAMFLLAFNQRFWIAATHVSWPAGPPDVLSLALLALLLLLSYAGLLLLVPGRVPMMVLAGLLFPVGAMAAYCADSFGVVIDREMIRNLGQTDQREIMGLLTPRLLLYVLALGVLPVFVVARCRIAALGWRRQLWHRLLFILVAAGVAGTVSVCFDGTWRTLANSHQLRYLSVPGAPLAAAAVYFRSELAASEATLADVTAAPASRLARQAGARPLLVFFVIGETARHKSFQLGGYARETNPALSRIDDLYYFGNAQACATSTALSVPCMLSHLGRSRFSPAAYRQTRNVLEELAGAGIDVEWRSNNTAAFDPGKGIAKVDFDDAIRASLCGGESCLDRILLDGLERRLDGGTRDRLLVFHQMGSHGPAYFLRYPPGQEAFRPACRRKDLTACSGEELRNAYDNTILYSDRLLADKVALLQENAGRYDTALIYVSDHGESLGENGLFLHSAPYLHAPEEQKRIPFMLWLSQGFGKRLRIEASCMRRQLQRPLSHDHVYHTLLGMLETRNSFYDSGMDVLSACSADERQEAGRTISTQP